MTQGSLLCTQTKERIVKNKGEKESKKTKEETVKMTGKQHRKIIIFSIHEYSLPAYDTILHQ